MPVSILIKSLSGIVGTGDNGITGVGYISICLHTQSFQNVYVVNFDLLGYVEWVW